MSPKFRKALILIVAIGVLAYFLLRSGHLINIKDFSGARLWDAIRGANYPLLLLSILTIYACYAIRAWRWRRFQAYVGPANFWNIYSMNLAGFSAVFLLGRAGEPVRPLLISRKDKVPLADTFGIYALERILDFAFTAVLAGVGLLVFEAHHVPGGSSDSVEKMMKTAGTFFSVGACVAIAALVYLRLHGSGVLERRMESWLDAHGWRASVGRILLGISRGVQTIRTLVDLIYALLLSVIHWVVVIFSYYLILHSFGGRLAELSFTDATLVLVFTMVGSVAQLPGVGGGAQALAIFALTRLFGVEQEPAVAAAIVLWLITFAACTLAGVPLLFKEGWSFGKLKEMSEHEDEVIDAEMHRATAPLHRGDTPE